MVGSATGGESLGEGGVEVRGGIEVDGLSGIGYSDDPLPEFQEPEDEPFPHETSAANHDTGNPGDRVVRPVVVDQNHPLHVFLRPFRERRREKVERGNGGLCRSIGEPTQRQRQRQRGRNGGETIKGKKDKKRVGGGGRRRRKETEEMNE